MSAVKFYFKTIASGLFVCLFLAVKLNAQAPINDDPCNAISLPVMGSCVFYSTYSNVGATPSSIPQPKNCFLTAPANNDVWFSVIVPSSGNLWALADHAIGSLSCDYDMAIYFGTCSSMVEIGCDDLNGPGFNPAISVSCLSPGQTIFIRIYSWSCVSSFQVCAYDGGCSGVMPPSIQGQGEVCLGDTEIYSIKSLPVAGTYHWSVTNGQILSGGTTSDTSVTILWNNAGNGNVTAYYNCCGSLSYVTSKPVKIFSPSTQPSLHAAVTTGCPGCPSMLYVAPGSLGVGSYYEWHADSCDGPVIAIDSSSILVNPLQTTSYFVRAIDTSGCYSSTGCDQITINVSTVGIDQKYLESIFEVLPNPSTGEFIVKCPLVKKLEKISISLYNTIGEKVYETRIDNEFVRIKSDFSEGLYFLVFSSNEYCIVKKIMIKF